MGRRLVLPFESIQSLPGGVNEVRLYYDDLLDVQRVAKRFDRSMLDATVLPEASTLQAIDHQNVVKVSLAARVDGYDPTMDVIEIHTPFYPRGSITDALLRGDTFAGRDALVVMQSALRGLRELHMTHRVLHRDIKSGNILLDEAPTYALVADIGVAGRMDENGTAPAVNNPTPYSPPEFRTNALTVTADLYSMGLVLRELVGGRFAYEAITRDEVTERLARGQRALSDEVLELPIWAPARLRRVYQKAIERARDVGRSCEGDPGHLDTGGARRMACPCWPRNQEIHGNCRPSRWGGTSDHDSTNTYRFATNVRLPR
jgi:serine/threonine protein kinase